MYRVLKKITLRGLLIYLLSFSLLCFALQGDNKEKIHIQSDSTIYNYKTGVKIFEGNVKVDQGSTHITADRLVTKDNHQHQIQEAIAYALCFT